MTSLIIRGLPISATEESIYNGLIHYFQTAISFEHIRIIRDKSGTSKGIAVVSCHDRQTAEYLLQFSGNVIVDGYPVSLELGHERKSEDWDCLYCKISNYHWRTQCFKCLVPRNNASSIPEHNTVENLDTKKELEGNEDKTSSPSRFLLIQNTDGRSAQDIFKALSPIAPQLNRVWSLSDIQTSNLKNFAFLEFENIEISRDSLSTFQEKGNLNGWKPSFSFGRDLHILNKMYLKSDHFIHWNPLYTLFSYPPNSPESDPSSAQKIFSIQPKPPLPQPAKKIKMQFKSWNKRDENSNNLMSENQTTLDSDNISIGTRVQCFLDPFLLCCFLCHETFDESSDLLTHGQSHSHVSKVESYCDLAKNGTKEESSSILRDRAAERRNLFGGDEIPEMFNKSEEPFSAFGESFGSKILKKMGWVEGKGLGATEQGITKPIKALQSAISGAGLGASSLEEVLFSSNRNNESYQQKTKRAFLEFE